MTREERLSLAANAAHELLRQLYHMVDDDTAQQIENVGIVLQTALSADDYEEEYDQMGNPMRPD